MSAWTFQKYPKIQESTNGWKIDDCAQRELDKLEWVVTEKIHGANFCFVSDGTGIRCANRRDFLQENESFMNHEQLLVRLGPQIRSLFHCIKRKFRNTVRVSVYGEIFGGAYPHSDVRPVPDVRPVQTGIYYAPDIEFCAFDVSVTSMDGTCEYIDYADAVEVFEEVGIFYAKPLFIGKLSNALWQPEQFESTIPGLLGLPPLGGPNRAEGIVIKPFRCKGQPRCVVKKKIAEFSEDKRYSQAEKWDTQSRTGGGGGQCENFELVKWEVYNLVTEMRLRNAISKLGYRQEGKRSRSRELFAMMVDDVKESVRESDEAVLETLSQRELNEMEEFVGNEVRTLFADFFKREKRRV